MGNALPIHEAEVMLSSYVYDLKYNKCFKKIPVGARFFARPDWSWGPPSLLYNGYRVFPGGKLQPGRAADHSSPSCVAVMEE